MKQNLIFSYAGSILLASSLFLGGCSEEPKKAEPKPEKQKTQSRAQKTPNPKQISETVNSEENLPKEFSKTATLEILKKNLDSKDLKKKAHAILGLGFYKDKDSIGEIRKSLRNPAPAIQKAAIQALASLQDQGALKDFYKLFSRSKDNQDVRIAILNAMRTLHNEETIEFLKKKMSGLEPHLAAIAYEILVSVEPPMTVEPSSRVDLDSFTISGVIGKGENAKIQIEREFFAVNDLILGYKIKTIDTNERIVTLEKDGKLFSKEIDANKKDPIEKAIEKINSKEDTLVYEGLTELRFLQSPKAKAELIALVHGGDAKPIRIAAIHTLAACKISDAEEELKKLLAKEKDDDLLIAVTEALSTIGTDKSFSFLETTAQNKNAWVRNSSVFTMGIMGSQHLIASLVNAVFDPLIFVRNNAYNQLLVLAEGGFARQIYSTLKSYANTKQSDRVEPLMNYLKTLPMESEDPDDPYSRIEIREKAPGKPKFKPDFAIISLGSFGTKLIATIQKKGDPQQNLTIGEKISNFGEILKIDVENEELHLKLSDGKIAILSPAGEEVAEVVEIRE